MKNASIPYVWKINDYLLRGRVNIVNIWENGLAWCYGVLYEATATVKTAIPNAVSTLSKLPVEFFTLIFGKRSLTKIYTPDYGLEVQKDFWTDIFNNELRDIKN